MGSIMNHEKQTAANLTVLGIDSAIRHCVSILKEIESLDKELGDRYSQARSHTRQQIEKKLGDYREALRIKTL